MDSLPPPEPTKLDTSTPLKALQVAIQLADNSQSELARRIGKKQANIWKWLRAGQAAPDSCIAIETAVGGRVTRYELRPDVFGAGSGQTAA